MKAFESFYKDHGEVERCSHRFQSGVEIFEREVHKLVLPEPTNNAAAIPEPRLVISDAVSNATRAIVSKTRSEIAGLNAFLKSLSGVKAESQ